MKKLDDPLTVLRTTGADLPDPLRAAILAMGDAAVAPLLALIEDEDAGAEDSPGGGWPPIHAVEILTALGTSEAIEPLLDVLLSTSREDIIHDQVIVYLPTLGAPVLEPAMAALEVAYEEEDEEGIHSLCSVLSELGVQDERVYRALSSLFEEEPVLAAMYLADYGDKRALPLLAEAIEACEPDWGSELPTFDVSQLKEAYEQLGGPLPERLQQRVDAFHAEEERRKAAAKGRSATGQKIGRNDPCPCGSGKKYKKCCLGKASAP